MPCCDAQTPFVGYSSVWKNYKLQHVINLWNTLTINLLRNSALELDIPVLQMWAGWCNGDALDVYLEGT